MKVGMEYNTHKCLILGPTCKYDISLNILHNNTDLYNVEISPGRESRSPELSLISIVENEPRVVLTVEYIYIFPFSISQHGHRNRTNQGFYGVHPWYRRGEAVT